MGEQSNPAALNRAGRLELILSQLEHLPTLPAVALQLLQLTADWDANAKQIVSLIESDAPLTAKILKLARRADSGISPKAARTVERAVMMLGFEAVRSAVLSIKVFETFGPEAKRRQPSSFDRREFWKHSLAVGCAARLLAAQLPDKIDPEEAFVCGLLHDLGKVALDAILPKSYNRAIKIAQIERTSLCDVENRLLGTDHCVVGRRLGIRWRLPESITTTMWLHHQEPDSLPPNVPGREYAKIAYAADLLVREHRIGFSGNYLFAQNSRILTQQMGVGAQKYEQILRRLAEDIEQRAQLLGLERITREDIFLKALAEANTELGRLNEDFSQTNRKLQHRSKYFGILTQLTDSLRGRDDLAAVCGSCAQAVCQALGSEGGAVLAANVSTGVCAVGHFRNDEIGTNWTELSDVKSALPGDDAAEANGRLRPQQISVDSPLLKLCEPHVPAGTAWLLPLQTIPDWHSAAVVAATHEQVQQWQADSLALDGLLGSVCLALQHAISAHRAAELAESLAEQARQLHETEPQRVQQKSLDIVAEMAGGAGHEMNNPLAIIVGRAQLLLGKIADPQIEQAAETIAEQAQRCSQIVSDLMDFARPEPPQPAALDLGAELAAASGEWRRDNGLSTEQVVVAVPKGLPKVRFDPEHLGWIVRELFDNSLHATEEDAASLRINCHAEASDESVVVRIADNGPGMNPEVLAKALLPFFSHRTAGRRRGLGLSRAYRLAELNGGNLWLESTMGEGTVVYLRMPAAKTAHKPKADKASQFAAAQRTEHEQTSDTASASGST